MCIAESFASFCNHTIEFLNFSISYRDWICLVVVHIVVVTYLNVCFNTPICLIN